MSFVFLGPISPRVGEWESGRVGRKRVEGCVTARELDERIKSQSNIIPCPIHENDEMIPVKGYHGTRNWIRIFEWIFDYFSGPGTYYSVRNNEKTLKSEVGLGLGWLDLDGYRFLVQLLLRVRYEHGMNTRVTV